MAASMMESLTKLGFLGTGGMPNITIDGNNTTAGIMDTILASAGQASPLLQLILFVYRMLGLPFGLDPSVLLTVIGVLWATQYAAVQAYHYVEDIVDKHLMCSITVSDNDRIYDHLMEWLSNQPSLNNHRYLTAQTVWRSAWEEDDEEGEEGNGESHLFWTDAGQGDGGKYLNFSNQAARSVPRFVPAMGTTSFWHKRTRFRVYRKKEALVNTTGWTAMKDQEEIKISCYGRNIKPIKLLLAEAKIEYYHDTHRKTTIYRPRQKEQRRDYSMWQQVARRPVRPMSTVVLDDAEKHSVLADINEYLHPRTPNWYASRGIPLRRGYLFHGPPGTGKTSFSFALAGVFGIDIYVISLQDISVTEEDLAALFASLPRRCIVLLEDIDTAGLRRTDDESESEKTTKGIKDAKTAKLLEKGDQATNNVNGTHVNGKVEKTKKKAKKVEESDVESDTSEDESEDEPKKRSKHTGRRGRRTRTGEKILAPEMISLSGLLNAIDGVASHEGRVLIMTTNKPESLDAALVRPGRVDMQVGFTHASSQQSRELFQRMFEARSRKQQKIQATNSTQSSTPPVQEPPAKKLGAALDNGNEKRISSEELKELAAEFGSFIPEGVFSPAEIQGFLLKRKTSPRKAIADVREWIEATLKQKETKSKVTTVQ